MKNPFSRDFKPEQSKSAQRMTLDPGAYVCGIIGAKADDEKLTIQVEITEGPAAGFFKQEFESQDGRFRAPRYKGAYVLRFPDGRNENADKWRERDARSVAWAVEKSNPGYHWAWETLERDLKGKAVGINVRERDWGMVGDDGVPRTGTTWEIGQLEDVNAVRDGKVKPMKKRELSASDKAKLDAAGMQATPPSDEAPQAVDVGEELPF